MFSFFCGGIVSRSVRRVILGRLSVIWLDFFLMGFFFRVGFGVKFGFWIMIGSIFFGVGGFCCFFFLVLECDLDFGSKCVIVEGEVILFFREI